jgi:hypothetical protein
MRTDRLDAQAIPEIKEWAIAFVRRHWDAPDRDALLGQALRERLAIGTTCSPAIWKPRSSR